MSTWLTAVIPFAGLGIVAAIVLLRDRHRRRPAVPGRDKDGEPLSVKEARDFAWLKLMHNHGATAPEPEYGRKGEKA